MKFVDLVTGVLTLAVIAAAVSQVGGQEVQIGIIEFYGVNQVSRAELRKVLTFNVGDSISVAGDDLPVTFEESEARLSKVPGVVGARTNLVCCDNGRAIVYVGIRERGAPTMRLRDEPGGKARLAADIVEAGDEFSRAFM